MRIGSTTDQIADRLSSLENITKKILAHQKVIESRQYGKLDNKLFDCPFNIFKHYLDGKRNMALVHVYFDNRLVERIANMCWEAILGTTTSSEKNVNINLKNHIDDNLLTELANAHHGFTLPESGLKLQMCETYNIKTKFKFCIEYIIDEYVRHHIPSIDYFQEFETSKASFLCRTTDVQEIVHIIQDVCTLFRIPFREIVDVDIWVMSDEMYDVCKDLCPQGIHNLDLQNNKNNEQISEYLKYFVFNEKLRQTHAS